jgi:predicted enzyme related to lactoylglutathione lyase
LGTEHLLLAMLGGEGGIAGRVLRERADPEALRKGVIEALAAARSAEPTVADLPDGATAERLPSAGVTGPYVELPVSDIERARAFFRDGLGLRAHGRRGRGAWTRLSWGEATVVLRAGAETGTTGFEVADVGEARAAVTRAGGSVVSGPDHLGRVAVSDPEGNLLTLSEWRAVGCAVTDPGFLRLVGYALAADGAVCVGQASFGGPDHTWFVVQTIDELRRVVARGDPVDRFTVSTRPWEPMRGRGDDPALLRNALVLAKRPAGILMAAGMDERGQLVDAEEAGRADEVREWLGEHQAEEVWIAHDLFWPPGDEIVAYVPGAHGTLVVGSY